MVLIGYVGITATLGYMLKGVPVRAHALAPTDGRVTALLAQQRLASEATRSDWSETARLARLALRQDPTAVHAAATLGLEAQSRGDVTSARRLFTYAQALSRRDLTTQLWIIEDAVARGDVAGALRHYDIALRTNRDAPDILFPILGRANTDIAVRTSLARTLASRPIWKDAFIGYLIGSGSDWRPVADLLLQMRRLGANVPSDAEATTISGLISSGFPEDAWRYYAAIRPRVDRRFSRDPRFAAEPTSSSPFDWVSFNDGGLSASIQGGIVEFAASPGAGGPVLQQMQFLPPGDYVLDGHGSDIDQSESSRPYWQLTCIGGRELGRAIINNSDGSGSSFKGRFNVPSNCPVQTLTLIARPSDAVAGTTGRIDRVQLRPIR